MNTGQLPATGTSIRVVLMCENPIVYKSLGPRLSADRSFEVAGTYDCTIEQVPAVMLQQPQVVILGISRVTHFNKIIAQALRQAAPHMVIVMLPSYLDTPDDASQACTAGADIVLEKSIDTPTLVEQIHSLLSQTP